MSDGEGVRIQVAARSDVGCLRERNEDFFCVADLTRQDCTVPASAPLGDRGFLFLVCDGMGGHVAGQVASRLAVEMIRERMLQTPAGSDQTTLARRLRAAVRRANARIYRASDERKSLSGMGTTVSAAAMVGDRLVLAQVGDSRAYLVREGRLVQLTRDQSLVEELLRTGQLTEVEAADFEQSNIILQALGVSAEVDVVLTRAFPRRGDRLLVCSDGLSSVVEDERIARAVMEEETPDAACRRLIELAREAGGPDNITCIVARLDGPVLSEARPGEPVDHGPFDVATGAEDALARDEGGAIPIAPELLAAEDGSKASWTTTLPAINPMELLASPSPGSGRRVLWTVLGVLALGGAAVLASLWVHGFR